MCAFQSGKFVAWGSEVVNVDECTAAENGIAAVPTRNALRTLSRRTFH